MHCSKSFFYRFVYVLTIVPFLGVGSLHAQAILAPVEDVFFYTFGGGQGCNTFLKYDITSVPSGRIIDSIFLTPYVYLINGGWNGNMDFWNVNDQDWSESDSCNLIWNLPTSDSTHQAGGFGTAVGWTQSVDLTPIFLTDYNVGNTYCSIKMKDPDEMTSVPMPGSYPLDYDDSLMVGDRAIGAIGYIVFYPHEWANGPPWLNIFYHDVGVTEEQVRMDALTLSVYPNPFKFKTDITFDKVHPERRTHSSHGTRSVPSQGDENPRLSDGTESVELKIYNATGRFVRVFPVNQCNLDNSVKSVCWDGTDQAGCRVPPGVYFCRLETGDKTIIEKICLIK